MSKTCSRTKRRLKLFNTDLSVSLNLLVIIKRAQAESIIDIFLDFPIILIVPAYFEMHLIFVINFLEIVIRNFFSSLFGVEVVHGIVGLISFTVRVLAHAQYRLIIRRAVFLNLLIALCQR